MKAIILAAGYGTRLKPLTDNKPKALIEVNGKTLLEICILKLKNEGIKDIIVNVHHFSEQIIKYLKEKNNFNINIQISEEEKLLDTGGGIKKARWFLDDKDPFLVYNVDIISDIDIQKFYNFHIKNNPLVSLAVSDRKSTNYLLFDSNNFLAGWKSYKTDKQIISRKCDSFRQYAFSGIHILSPEIFELFENKETFSIITPYLKLSKEKELLAFHHNHKNWFDAGSVEKLEKLKGINI